MKLLPPGLKNQIKSHFNELKKETGKWITVYNSPDKTDCPNCLSSHTGESVGVFDDSFTDPVEIYGEIYSPISFSRGRCPVCYGKGYLERESTTKVHAITHWNPPDDMSKGDFENTPGGLEGSNIVRVKADKKYYGIIRDCTKAVIDGVECILHFPPYIRYISNVDVMCTAYFISNESGHNTRE